MSSFSSHPALQEFDLSHYKGLRGQNFYQIDLALQRVVNRGIAQFPDPERQAILNHLNGYGELVGGILDELTEACHKEGKYGELVKYDRTGNRIDTIQYSPEQMKSRKISFDYGICNLDFHPNWQYSFSTIHKYALAYLLNLNGEGGVACPLAMTDGLILALKEIGTEEQKAKYLPFLASPKSESHFMAGQFVTERVGGSNVAANRTTAKQSQDGKWILNGEKWFCSNPGDLWVTTAKVEGSSTIGLFLVPRYKSDGSLNGHHILRKKDIIGSRGKVTVEIIYQDVEAESLGRISHGLANLIKYIIRISRLHVAIGALGNSKRAIKEAIEYSQWRTAYGQKISNFGVLKSGLAEMQIHQTILTWVVFRFLDTTKHSPLVENTLAPLLKYISSSQASLLTQKSMLTLGGNGIIGDFSPLPRLHNDSIINETWEGTHLLITEHLLHALRREKVWLATKLYLENMISSSLGVKELQEAIEILKAKILEFQQFLKVKSKDWQDRNRVYLADKLYECFALAELVDQFSFDQDSSVLIVLKGYLEILKNGKFQAKDEDGIFFDDKSLDVILKY